MKIFVLLATNPLDFFYKQPYVSLGYVRLVRSRRKTVSLLDLLATNSSDFSINNYIFPLGYVRFVRALRKNAQIFVLLGAWRTPDYCTLTKQVIKYR